MMLCVLQTGQTVAMKKVALRRSEEGIPNQALREIKALQEIQDNPYVGLSFTSYTLNSYTLTYVPDSPPIPLPPTPLPRSLTYLLHPYLLHPNLGP